jgi:diguanylate cyclase (GGDEF)-like protein/PAS domain S-box-containing protein
MIAPLPDDSTPADQPRRLDKLVRKWANLVTSTTYVPLHPTEFEQRLGELAVALVDSLAGTPEIASECGAELVAMGCTDPVAVQSTMDILGPGLLALPELAGLDRLPEKVVQLLGRMAAGYAAALRQRTFAQQETLSLALRRTLAEVQENLSTASAQFDHVVAASASGVAITDRDGRFLRTNGRLRAILGYTEAELAGLTVFDVIPGLLDGRSRQRLSHKDNEVTWASLALLESVDGKWVIVLEDRSELDLLHGQLNHQALHDMVTRLPNRQFFTSTLERALRTTELTVYHLDLDGFGQVTHGIGRRAGDMLLSTAGRRLEALVADEKAMVARFYADEFAILVENSPVPPDVTVRRINDTLADTVEVEGHEVAMSACIGVVDRPGQALSAAEVLDAAELALARARRVGSGQWSMSDPYQDTRDREAFRRAVSGDSGRSGR